MRLPAVLLSAVAVAAVGAPNADADRAPSTAQRAAIARVSGAPTRCLIIRVSSVSSAWGSYRFNAARYTACKKYAADGIAIVRLSGGRWHDRYAGSDCKNPTTRLVPRKVWRDLSRDFCER